jgi:Family of unknown function (DUF6174)
MKTTLFLALSGFLMFCSCSDMNIFTPRLITNLDDAEARWKAHNLTKYSFTQRRSCFCIPQNYPLTVQMDSLGNIAFVRDARGTSVNASSARTIAQMFTDIRTLQSRTDASVQVKYDSVYGYPRSIVADPIKNATDDEYFLETTLVR